MPGDAGPHNSGQRTVLLLKWWAPKVTQKKKGPLKISGPGLGVPESTSDSKGSHIFIRIKQPKDLL